jgi:import inner membrane translocase subunit TIM22
MSSPLFHFPDALLAGAFLTSYSYLLQFRAKNDITNAVAAGFVSGAVLARNSGPRAAAGGGLAFAAFSAAIDLFMRRESAE